jgi:hypothetical protein
MIVLGVEEPGLEEAGPHRLGWRRRAGVVALGVILTGTICGIVGLALVQSSWWHANGQDSVLDHETRARVEAIRDSASAGDASPEATKWLDAALDPNIDPSSTRIYLLLAVEALRAAEDPAMDDALVELRGIVQTIRISSFSSVMATPYAVSTPAWP